MNTCRAAVAQAIVEEDETEAEAEGKDDFFSSSNPANGPD
jgi:hypothetical protein